MNTVSKVLLWLAIAVILVVALLWPQMRDAANQPAQAAPATPAPRPAVPVRVFTVRPQLLEDKIQVNGNILPDEEAELRGEVSGRVVDIHFEEGQTIEAGTILVKINDAELQAEKKRLTHEISLATDIEKRQRRLLAEGTTSQENYDRALNRLNTLDAELEVVNAQLEKNLITAPFDGVVGFRYISTGSYVTPNTLIAHILKIDPVKIDFAIPEKYADKVGLGNRVSFSLPSKSGTFQGEVYAIEPRIDPVTRTLPIRARAANPDGRLIPGSFASVSLVFEERTNALLIPSEALIPILSGQKVFVELDGKAHERVITTGIRTDRMVEVTQGLKAGERVITAGILSLREGAAVKVTDQGQPETGGGR